MKLVSAIDCTETQVLDYFLEWKNHKEEIIPTCTDLSGISFVQWKAELDNPGNDNFKNRKNAQEYLYFLIKDSGAIVGAISVKHKLTPYLKVNGGNIAYGVRFSERNKGYGRYMLKRIVELWFETRNDGIQVACFSRNLGSSKIIESCGGELIRRKNTKNGEKSIYGIARVQVSC